MSRWFSVYYAISEEPAHRSLAVLPLHVSHGPFHPPNLIPLSSALSALLPQETPPRTQMDQTFSSSGILLISHCKYRDKSFFLVWSEPQKPPRTNNHGLQPYFLRSRALAPFISSPLALPPLDPSGDTQVWNCKCLLSGSEADVRRSVALCMILLRRGADERISYSRA